MGAVEAWLLGLTLAGAVLLVEMLTTARGRPQYFDAVRAGGAGLQIVATYSILFTASCLAGWLVARLAGRGVARRSPAVFLGVALSAVPVFAAAITIHAAVRLLLSSWSVAPLLGILALAAAASLTRAARSGSALALEFATAVGVTFLLGLAAGVTAAQMQNAVALLQLDRRTWLSLADRALIFVPIAFALSLALHGIHVDRSVRRLMTTSALFLGLCVLAPYGLAPIAANRFEPSADATSPHPSVLLIVIDTLRADFVLSADGSPGTTPAIEALARDGIVFDQAHAAAPWTLSSFGSILSSTYPSQHRAGLRDPETYRRFGLSPSLPTLAESLHAAGFVTAGVLTNGYLSWRYGLGRGFDAYENLLPISFYHPIYRWIRSSLGIPTDPYVRAEREGWRVLSMLDHLTGTGRPFFLLAHFMDPHAPALAPEAFYDKPAGERTLVDHYRAEVRYVDHAIGGLLDALRSRGVYDDLLIVLTSDHGEELFEGRPRVAETAGETHGHSLYEELLHVPLIVKLPHGRLAGTHRAELVSGIDIAPTILGAVGVQSPGTFVGLDVFGDKGVATQLRDRVLFAEGMILGPELQGAMRGNQKIIRPSAPPEEDVEQDFDLSSDPLEKRPITAPDALAEFAGLRDRLVHYARAGGGDRGAARPVDLSPEQLERLRSLGYVARPQRSP